jgi:HTH-type transcriptional regulator, glycine betaine synthesis regulator
MPDGMTFDDIVKFLNASKSSISNSLNYFLQRNRIVYFTKPGDRKRYFKIPFSSFWLKDLES